MTVTPIDPATLFAGIDTHAETIHLAVIDAWGRELSDHEFPTTPTGYQQALAFLASHGEVTRIGIEGTSSYGLGITRAAHCAGFEVVEVTRPSRAARRSHGKSDALDAYHAARAALSGHNTAPVKTTEINALRALRNARRSAVKARSAAQVEIGQHLIGAPDAIRHKYRDHTTTRLINALASCRPATRTDTEERVVLIALKSLAQRHLHLTAEITTLETELTLMVDHYAPHLLHLHGVGPITAAQLLITAGGNPDRLTTEAAFAALCGASPVPASSGKTSRHRLCRGGDRQANHALHTIAVVRMRTHPRTKEFVQHQRDKGRTTPEILRILKRAIAREMFKHLTRPQPGLHVDDLRPARHAKNLTLTAAAHALGVSITTLSRTERGQGLTPELVTRYRQWLNNAA